MTFAPQPVVFAAERHADLLRAVLPERSIFVKNRRELFGALYTRGAVAFVDLDLLEAIDGARIDAPIVAVIDRPAVDSFAATLEALQRYPWLSHVVQAPLLSMERARAHFEQLLDRLTSPRDASPLGFGAVGRTALVRRSSHRGARLDRMREFFTKRGVAERVISALVDVGEELVMNGLYNAPMEAGFFSQACSRADELELPIERACEISYGIDDATTFVRLRDTFGALKRSRLIEVLERCRSHSVELDETRGGAGLGLYRIFSAASTIAITVVPGSLTDITVVIGTRDSRRIARPLAVDLCFIDGTSNWTQAMAGDEHFLIDHSITLFRDGSTPTPTPTPAC